MPKAAARGPAQGRPRAGPRPWRARNPQGLKRKLFRPPFTHRVSTRPRGMPAGAERGAGGAELPGRPQPPGLRKNSRRPPPSSRAPQIPPRNPRPRTGTGTEPPPTEPPPDRSAAEPPDQAAGDQAAGDQAAGDQAAGDQAATRCPRPPPA